jgi:hypothetical protein
VDATFVIEELANFPGEILIFVEMKNGVHLHKNLFAIFYIKSLTEKIEGSFYICE